MKTSNSHLFIGKIKIANNLVMAPMAGITDMPFRILAKEGGAGLVCTEMISARALIYDDTKTLKLLQLSKKEHPVSVQLFGSDAETIAKAGKIVENQGADILDINFGCPVRKIIKSGSGSKLLENEKGMAEIMELAVKSVKIPVTIKTRIGQKPGDNLAPQVAKLAEKCGISAVSIHGRYASQGHAGEPVLESIAETVSAVSIPIIGNGGIVDEFSAKEFLDKTKCAGLMIGRSAIGDFGIFNRVEHFLKTGGLLPQPSWEQKIEVLKKHAKMSVEYYGEKKGLTLLRKLAIYYMKGMPNASKIRNKFNRISTVRELDALLEETAVSPYIAACDTQRISE